MPELAKHHRDELVVAGPITSLFPYANTIACNKSKITFLQIADVQEVETTMAPPHLLTPECQEETNVVPEQVNVLAEQAYQCLITKERQCNKQLSTTFIPITYTYDSTNLHGGGMMCTQAGGRRGLS